MDTRILNHFCEKTGNNLATILLQTYKPADFEIDSEKIEREIYDLALSYAKIFFFESREFLSEESRSEVQQYISTRFSTTEREVKKMKDIELAAHWIKLEAIEQLRKHRIVLW